METGEDGGKMSANRLPSAASCRLAMKRCITVAGTNRLIAISK